MLRGFIRVAAMKEPLALNEMEDLDSVHEGSNNGRVYCIQGSFHKCSTEFLRDMYTTHSPQLQAQGRAATPNSSIREGTTCHCWESELFLVVHSVNCCVQPGPSTCHHFTASGKDNEQTF